MLGYEARLSIVGGVEVFEICLKAAAPGCESPEQRGAGTKGADSKTSREDVEAVPRRSRAGRVPLWWLIGRGHRLSRAEYEGSATMSFSAQIRLPSGAAS